MPSIYMWRFPFAQVYVILFIVYLLYYKDPGDPVTFSDLNPLMEDNYVLMVCSLCPCMFAV